MYCLRYFLPGTDCPPASESCLYFIPLKTIKANLTNSFSSVSLAVVHFVSRPVEVAKRVNYIKVYSELHWKLLVRALNLDI